MDIKRVCRLCCSNDEVKYSLFIRNESGLSLAEEFRTLTEFEITKEDHLSEHVCVNCFKVNSFFKEFRKNCLEVNNYFQKLPTSEKSLPGDIIIKEEQLDDYEDHSADPSGNQREETSRNPRLPYPVALVQSSQQRDDLNQLQSNFLASKRSREESGSSITPENKNSQSSTPVRRGEKRKNGDAEDIIRRQRPRVDIPTEEDLLNHVVKQEEVDISESLAGNDTFNEESGNVPSSPPDSRPSLDLGNVGGHLSPDDGSSSSLSYSSSCSSDDSDDDEDDSDMLMLLALLL